MSKAYVMLVSLGVKDTFGESIQIKREVIQDAEVVVGASSAQLASFTAPTDFENGRLYTRYMWIVKTVDGAARVTQGMDPDAETDPAGYRLKADDVEEFPVLEPGETLSLVAI